MRGGLNLADNILTIDAGPKSRIAIAHIAIPDLARTTLPVALSPVKVFRAVFDPAGTPRLRTFKGALAMTGNRFAVMAGPALFDIQVAPVTLGLSGTRDRLQIAIEDAALTVPAYGIDATNIAVGLRMDDAAALTLSVGKISQRGPNPIVVPLRLDATATRKGGKIAFSGRLSDRPERLSIRATGQYDIAANSGASSIDADLLAFLPTVLQPGQLFPALENTLREVDGQIGGHARLQWRAGGLVSSAELFIQLNSLKVEGAAVKNAAATIVFDSLFPLSTPPKQEIQIGRLDIGVPLIKGRVEFQIGPDGAIGAALREIDFFGGRIESPMVAIPPSLDGFSVPLLVTGVQLESLFDLADFGDLEAAGTLNGKLELAIKNGTVALRRGVLESAPGGGVIRYRPQSVGPALANANEGAELFLKLVEDFEYDSVRVTLNEDPPGGIASRFEIKGRNAAVYDGFPVELNISMSGPLRDILNQSIKTYTLPERLLTQIQTPGDAQGVPSGN